MLEKLALSYDDFVELKKYCEQIGIGFLSTPFDEDSIRFLDSLDMDFKGKAQPVVKPGEFIFSAAHLDHGHIYGMTNGLLEAGGTLTSCHIHLFCSDVIPKRLACLIQGIISCQSCHIRLRSDGADSFIQVIYSSSLALSFSHPSAAPRSLSRRSSGCIK